MLAKEAATADVLTDGRFELGVGTGSRPDDLTEAGLPVDTAGVKVERITEVLSILKLYYGGEERISYVGKHYQIKDLEAYPKPVQRPMPIMMGARGNRMLRLAAREADIIGVMMGGDEPAGDLSAKMAVVREAADDRYDQIVHAALLQRKGRRTAEHAGCAASGIEPGGQSRRDRRAAAETARRERHLVTSASSAR